MKNHVNAAVGCLMVGDFVDDGNIPAVVAVHPGEVVRPQVVATYADVWAHTESLREFTVLLKDGRIASVHGHSLQHSPNPVADQDVYSIVVRAAGEEMLIALFKSTDVAGIFHGELLLDRKIA